MRLVIHLKNFLFFMCAMTCPSLAAGWLPLLSQFVDCPDKMSTRDGGISHAFFIKGSFRGIEFGCPATYSDTPCGPFVLTNSSDNMLEPTLDLKARNGEMVTFWGKGNPSDKAVRSYCSPDEKGVDCWKVWSHDYTLTNYYTADTVKLNIQYQQNIKCNKIEF